MKKRIKTRRLTNIYHSDDDDVSDGSNLLSPPSLSLSHTLSLSLSLSVPLPLPNTAVSNQQSKCAKIFEHGVRVDCELNYHDPKIRRTLAHDIRKHWTAVSTLLVVYTVISTSGDQTSHRAENLQLSHQSISHISDAKLTYRNCVAN